MDRVGGGCGFDNNDNSYSLIFLSIIFSTFLQSSVKMCLWENIELLKNKFLVCAMENCLMEGKQDE